MALRSLGSAAELPAAALRIALRARGLCSAAAAGGDVTAAAATAPAPAAAAGLRIFIAATGADDAAAARLMAALRSRRGDVSFFGVGGPRMAAAGLAPILPPEALAALPAAELVASLPWFASKLHPVRADRADARGLLLPLLFCCLGRK
jgi:hypothetical protein